MGRWIGLIVALLAAIALVIALGEDGERVADAPAPPPTLVPAPPASVPATPPSSTTSTAPAAPEPASDVQPLGNTEDARKLLEAEGIDPAKLSDEIAEHMDRRFDEKGP